MSQPSRRQFLKTAITTACATGVAEGALAAVTNAAPLPIKKGVWMEMLPEKLSISDRFKLARDVGFEVVQAPTEPDERKAEEIKKASELSELRVDSVMNMDHWKYPLSSGDPEVAEKSLAGMRTSLRNAKLWGSDTVLLVPAVVDAKTSYGDAWTRSQTQIRKLLPIVEESKIKIGIEEVWNKFLLSPLEMARYIDELKSPWVTAWFDVGNVLLYGYPQDWIRTLGKRISNVHLKDFKRGDGTYAFVNLGDGDLNWPAVRQAFADIGYSGSAVVELDGGDEAYLRDVSKRVDVLLVR
jgi:hexulose-6-phosphate isomerase